MEHNEDSSQEQAYSILRPWVKEVLYVDGRDPKYKPLFDLSDETKIHEPLFGLGIFVSKWNKT